MVRKYRRLNRPPHICSRGPYRRKRDHLKDLQRWDCRDHIDQAVPDVDDPTYADDDDLEDEEMETIPDGWAEIDPRDRKYCIFRVEMELTPGHVETLGMYRGRRFPNTTRKQTNHFWFWLCPDCRRRCRYLYTLPGSCGIACRVCWRLPYRSQSKSPAQWQRERREREKALSTSFARGRYGEWYMSKGACWTCHTPPKPPRGWVPRDLMKLYGQTRKQTVTSDIVLDESI